MTNAAPARWSLLERAALVAALTAIVIMIAGAAGIPGAALVWDIAAGNLVATWTTIVDAVRAALTATLDAAAHLIGD